MPLRRMFLKTYCIVFYIWKSTHAPEENVSQNALYSLHHLIDHTWSWGERFSTIIEELSPRPRVLLLCTIWVWPCSGELVGLKWYHQLTRSWVFWDADSAGARNKTLTVVFLLNTRRSLKCLPSCWKLCKNVHQTTWLVFLLRLFLRCFIFLFCFFSFI